MFNFLKRQPNPIVPEPRKRDGLNETATQIAIDLLEGRGGVVYLACFAQVFKNNPEFVEEVDTEYRDKLKQLLREIS